MFKNKHALKHKKEVHVAAILLFFLYLLVLAYLLFFIEIRDATYHNINLVPFKTIRMLLSYDFSSWYRISNLYGNIALLAPFGLLLPLIRYQRLSVFRILLYALLFSVSIEIIQYLTGLGEADIDDVILNVSGALIGYAVYRFLGAIFK